MAEKICGFPQIVGESRFYPDFSFSPPQFGGSRNSPEGSAFLPHKLGETSFLAFLIQCFGIIIFRRLRFFFNIVVEVFAVQPLQR